MKNFLLAIALMFAASSASAQTPVTQAQVQTQQAQVATDRVAVVTQQKANIAALAPLTDTYNSDQAQLQVLQAELAAQTATVNSGTSGR